MIQARNGGGGAPPPPRAASFSHLAGQELYRAALFALFFLQIVAVGFVPYIGARVGRLLPSADCACGCQVSVRVQGANGIHGMRMTNMNDTPGIAGLVAQDLVSA